MSALELIDAWGQLSDKEVDFILDGCDSSDMGDRGY